VYFRYFQLFVCKINIKLSSSSSSSSSHLFKSNQHTYCLIDFSLRILYYRTNVCPALAIESIILIPIWIYPYFIRAFFLWLHCSYQETLLLEERGTLRHRVITWLRQRKWLSSQWSAIWLFMLVVFFSLVIAIPLGFHKRLDEPCLIQNYFVILTFQCLLAALMLAVCVYLLWNSVDAFLIKFELKVLVFLGIPFTVLAIVASALGWTRAMSPNLWMNILLISMFIMTFWVPVVASFSKKNRLLTSRKLAGGDPEVIAERGQELSYIFDDPVLLKSFKRYISFFLEEASSILISFLFVFRSHSFAAESWALENVLFYQEAREYSKLKDEESFRKKALKIQSQFLGSGFALHLFS